MPGSTAWERDAAAYERALEGQRAAAGKRPGRRRRRLKWVLVPVCIVAVLAAAALAMGPPDPPTEQVATDTPTRGPESISDNASNPPQADVNGDTECAVDDLGWVVASGSLTNHSSQTSSYTIHVSFNDGAAVRFAEAPAFHNDVRAGETVRWDAPTFTRPAEGAWTCEVVSIERFASQ